jgi:hypothetical protein
VVHLAKLAGGALRPGPGQPQASQQVPGFFGAQIQATPGAAGRVVGLPITSIEMLSVLGNTQVLFAHLIGLWISLWLLQRIYRSA